MRRRPPARFPVFAVALAGISVVLGAIGFQRVTAEPTEPITFVVDEGLPYGITQDTVEAAAEGIGLAYEPFTCTWWAGTWNGTSTPTDRPGTRT